jgi:hypothetical protein
MQKQEIGSAAKKNAWDKMIVAGKVLSEGRPESCI